MNLRRPLLIAAAALVAVPLAFAAAAPAKVKKNPENDARLGPDDNPGHFLGYPTPTYQWHGCTKTSTYTVPGSDLPPDLVAKGTAQSVVTFTPTPGQAPHISWKVAKKGWKICGVQASVTLAHPDVDSLLLAQSGYTSGKLKGSTAKSGKETIKVKIKKGDIASSGFEEFEGKTFTISRVNAVAVFVKKK